MTPRTPSPFLPWTPSLRALRPRTLRIAGLLALLCGAGCSTEWYRKSADEEVYELLAQRGLGPTGESGQGAFRLEQSELSVDEVSVEGQRVDLGQVPAPAVSPSDPRTSSDSVSGEGIGPDAADRQAIESAGALGPGAPPPGSSPEAPSESAPEAAPARAPDAFPVSSPGSLPEGAPVTPPASLPPAPPSPSPGATSAGDAPPPESTAEGTPAGETPAAESPPAEFPAANAPPGGAPGEGASRGASSPEGGAGTQEPPAAEPPAAGPAPSSPPLSQSPPASGDHNDPEVIFASAPRVITRVLDLRSALKLALANNREFQSVRESVYQSALSLTLARHVFAPRYFGAIVGNWDRASNGSESGSLDSSLGLTKTFANGARVSINLLSSLFQFFTGDRRAVARNIVSGALTQPLLRGLGSSIVREPLTQAERNLVYSIRSFHRFRKTFGVSVISEYYRVLQSGDRVLNAYLNWQSLVLNRDRAEELANAERLPRFEVDQARQQELQAQDEWTQAVQTYESDLDRFKITLGISVRTEITLDKQELARLAQDPVAPPALKDEAAIDVALRRRLDLLTARDRVEDRERQVAVAADGLQAQLDVSAEVALASNNDSGQQPFKFNSNNLAYGFGFDLDLPLDRKAERNSYVSSVISLESGRRDLSLLEDSIRLSVRDAYRRLERERVSYSIQQVSLALAEQRVDSTTELRQAGRSTTRDVLESQSSLNSARNALTSALINYAIANLQFLQDTELLLVDDSGEIAALDPGAPTEERNSEGNS